MLEIALGSLGSNGFGGAHHGVQQIVHGAGFGPFEKLFEFRPGLLDRVKLERRGHFSCQTQPLKGNGHRPETEMDPLRQRHSVPGVRSA